MIIPPPKKDYPVNPNQHQSPLAQPAPLVRPVEQGNQDPRHCANEHIAKEPLLPKRAQFFVNDLKEADKQKLIDTFISSARAILSEPQVTVNSVARLMAMEHAKVKAGLALGTSLKQFVDAYDSGDNTARLKRAAAKLTTEEREALIKTLQAMQ